MIRFAAVFLLGVGAALLARQTFDLYQAYGGVTAQWRTVRESDKRRALPVKAIVRLIERGKGDSDEIKALEDDLADIQIEPPISIIADRRDFESYDRKSMRLSHDIVELGRALNAAPSRGADVAFSPLQSQLEGTESASWQAHMNYNAVVLAYRALTASTLNHAISRVFALPVDVGLFEVFGEAGPRMPDGVKDDDD